MFGQYSTAILNCYTFFNVDVFQVQGKESELEVSIGTKTTALDAEEAESYISEGN